MATVNELEETLKELKIHRGVVGSIILDNKGECVTSTLNNETAMHYAQLFPVAENAKRTVRHLDPSDELLVLRLGFKDCEILLAPDKDLTMIVIQDVVESESIQTTELQN